MKQSKILAILFKLLNKTYYGSCKSVNDLDGNPHDLLWYTAITNDKNYQLFPIGYYHYSKRIL